LQEQNSKWLNDDYVKFIKYAQTYIDKNEEGVLAYITNNGYLDNPTFRGMRSSLLRSFNIIYSIDLHGSSKKQEKASDGSLDKNVFDIQQGVSIIIAIKKAKSTANCVVRTYDLLGSREMKYTFLAEKRISEITFKECNPAAPNYLLKALDATLYSNYTTGINPVELFKVNVMGFQTHRDDFAISWDREEVKSRAEILRDNDVTNEHIYSRFGIQDNRDWKLSKARQEIKSDTKWMDKITLINYRPFDNRPSYFSYVMMDYPRKELIINALNKDNILLGIGRQGLAVGDIDWCLAAISRYPIDANVFRRGGVNIFPLYLYPNTGSQGSLQEVTRVPNINLEIVDEIASCIKNTFTPEKVDSEGFFAPIDLVDYIYAVLHSPVFRKKYKEFLKNYFPIIPYPKSGKRFWQMVQLGGDLRELHLLETSTLNNYITEYPIDGNNTITKIRYHHNNVYINDSQYFVNVPNVAWEFYIGGYQPAQKWLKDRKERQLSFDEILHYQKMILALVETDKLMKEIDDVIEID